jgi:hypothetical protein
VGGQFQKNMKKKKKQKSSKATTHSACVEFGTLVSALVPTQKGNVPCISPMASGRGWFQALLCFVLDERI